MIQTARRLRPRGLRADLFGGAPVPPLPGAIEAPSCGAATDGSYRRLHRLLGLRQRHPCGPRCTSSARHVPSRSCRCARLFQDPHRPDLCPSAGQLRRSDPGRGSAAAEQGGRLGGLGIPAVRGQRGHDTPASSPAMAVSDAASLNSTKAGHQVLLARSSRSRGRCRRGRSGPPAATGAQRAVGDEQQQGAHRVASVDEGPPGGAGDRAENAPITPAANPTADLVGHAELRQRQREGRTLSRRWRRAQATRTRVQDANALPAHVDRPRALRRGGRATCEANAARVKRET
jgi:hypothetical protein